jgi:hypothetical protein
VTGIVAATAWVVMLALFAVGLALAVATRGIDVMAGQPPLLEQLAFFDPVLFAYGTVGTLLAARRPRNPIGWLFVISALCGTAAMVCAGYNVATRGTPDTLGPYVNWIGRQLGNGMFVPMLLVLPLFPTGTLRSGLVRLAVVLVLASAVLQAVAQGLFVQEFGESGTTNPFAIQGLAALYLPAQIGASITFAVGLLASIASLVVGYRGGGRIERLQMRWLLYAAFLTAAAVAAQLILVVLGERVDPMFANLGFIVFLFALGAIPISVGLAILRYRLYDIDLLIKRTLVYGATTVALAATFWIGILALQRLLNPVTSGSEIAIAASTLVSLALFQPIRRRVQDAVDRRFDRSRYDAAHLLDGFADRLRDEVDLEEVHSDLMRAIRDSMQPAHASLWLRGGRL